MPKQYKVLACAKHFAVHSGPENVRHDFDAEPPERDFYETYLPHFEAAVREGHVGAVMGAAQPDLRHALLCQPAVAGKFAARPMGLQGPHILSGLRRDRRFLSGSCGFSATLEDAAAIAVRSGCDLCCGTEYQALASAVKDKLLPESALDTAVGRLMEARFRLGMFDPPAMVPGRENYLRPRIRHAGK